jgi:ubiquinone/menaquinone biosynthesis C-methylase UbiE
MEKGTIASKYYDKVAKEYEKMYQSNYWKLYNNVTFDNIKKYLPKKGSLILDAGGGTGFWSRQLAKFGYRVVCTDIAQKMLDVGMFLAKKEKVKNKIEFKYADITNMNCFKDNSFDMAISEGDPVGYCGNPDKAIRELCRVVKRGAYIIISIDGFFSRILRIVGSNNFSQLKLLEEKHTTLVKEGKYAEHDFTINELKRLFKKNKLEVIDIIGKPMFVRLIHEEGREKMLADKKTYNKILALEEKYNNEPSIVGLAGHIEIVGRRI